MNNADKYLENKNKTSAFIKNKAFDLISIGIILAMGIISLGVIELREITLKEIGNLIVESVPFYLAATMLTMNYYTKGVFSGKLTESFKYTIKYYSDYVSKLSGLELKYLPTFCKEYNDRTLKDVKESLLHSVAITWEEYDEGINGNKPLKALSVKALESMYDKEITNVIMKCKHAKIKGIYPNILLSSIGTSDNTDLGYNEEELKKRRTLNYVFIYGISVFFMSLIAVKDIVEWGWYGAAVTLFKVLYIACGAYMKYFDGYEDVTVNLANHICRKTDILKEFDDWYKTKYANDSNKS